MGYQLHAHIVPVPKYRRNVMTDRVSDEIRAAILEMCTRFDSTFDAFETEGDHTHLMITFPSKVALSRLAMSMKTLLAMRVRAKKLAGSPRCFVGEAFLVTLICHCVF